MTAISSVRWVEIVRMKSENCWRVLTVIMCGLLALQSAFGQQVGGQSRLRIVVVEGANVKNVTQEIPLRPLTVRVEDANSRPVAGATVVFNSPETGPSGEFANDSRTFSAITGEDGLATARGYHPNTVTGAYQIQVRAESQGMTATAGIPQRNIAPQHGGRLKIIAILAIAGAAVGAVVAARSRTSPPATPTAPTITLGGGAVGAPFQ
jgi:hypothetical protein